MLWAGPAKQMAWVGLVMLIVWAGLVMPVEREDLPVDSLLVQKTFGFVPFKQRRSSV